MLNRHIEADIAEKLVFVHISVTAHCIIIILASHVFGVKDQNKIFRNDGIHLDIGR